jgi:hypothetical protein
MKRKNGLIKNKKKWNRRGEETEEWEVKGHACCPLHYPNSPYYLIFFHSQWVFWKKI